MTWRARCVPSLLAVLCAGFLVLLCPNLVRAQAQIRQIVPDHAIAGSPNLPVTVLGSNFSGGNAIVFNGVTLTTTFVSSTTLTATVPSTQLAAIASFSVHVNASPPSASLRFRVTTPLAPIDHTVPNQFVNVADTPVAVFGSGFDSTSTILFDWQPITTTFVSSTEVTGTVPSAFITPTQTHHIFVYAGAFTAASIGTLQSLPVIASDQPQIFISNVVIGTSLTGTATIRSLQGTITLSSPFYTITGADSADFAKSGGGCSNGKVLTAGSSCTIQITATPAAFPAPPPGWTPVNSYALNFEIVDDANGNPNGVPHLQKVTTAGTSGAVEPGGPGMGAISVDALDDAGTGYAANDTFTVNGGETLATGTVTSIGGGGAVTGINMNSAGLGYSLGTHVATTATSGSGTGMTVDITSITFDPSVIGAPWNESGGTTATDGSVVWADRGPYVLNISESATLTVNSNAANNPQSIPLALTKTFPSGGSPDLLIGVSLLNPAGYDFGSVTQSTPTSRTITLRNDGAGYMDLATPFYTIIGANLADFALSGGTCANGQNLLGGSGLQTSVGQSCTFNLTFTPSATGTRTATLNLAWNSIGGTVGSATQVLTGTGKAAGTKIHLAWTASTSSSVTGYKVYRGTQSGGPYTLLASPGNVTSYDDTTPVHGNTYCYVITTVGSNPPYTITESSFSAESCATF